MPRRETLEEYEHKKMEEHKKNLKKVLRELFQIEDAAELDHGMYRIMKLRREQVEEFINNGLIEEVDAVFGEYTAQQREMAERDKQALEEEILHKLGDKALAKDSIREDLLITPIAQELNERYLAVCNRVRACAMSDQHKGEVFSRIADFFGRYYDDGDFMSLRRYSADGKYAIPYNGEEVLLHWANKDQYYIKTERHLKNYGFEVGENTTVRFEVVKAESTKNNNKTEKRHLVLAPETEANDESEAIIPVEWKENARELIIRFQFITLDDVALNEYTEFIPRGAKRKNPNRDDVIKGVATKILEQVPGSDLKASLSLGKPGDNKPLLEKHITRFSSQHTSDYFIHKNLHKFLAQELDFYIKNEVFRLDDLTADNERQMQHYVACARVMKTICLRIIDFLAQMEEFQKKLWEKKKFVLSTNYCMTLDMIDEEFFAEHFEEIVVGMRDNWEELLEFNLDSSRQASLSSFLVEEPNLFQEANPYLILDTKNFDAVFVEKLLSTFENLEEDTSGLIIKSENWQALNLLKNRFAESINCIYIDPPYNTVEGTFVYKNDYKNSSWLSMMADRLLLARDLLPKSGTLSVAIDDTETSYLRIISDSIFGVENYIATFAIEINPAGQNLKPNAPALSHDYCHVFAKDISESELLLRELTPEEIAQYTETDSKGLYLWDNLRRRGGNSRPADRRRQWYPLYINLADKRVSTEPFENSTEIWPIDPKGENRIWRLETESAKRDIANGEISVIEKAGRAEIVKKTRMPDGKKPKTLWADAKYSATTYGTKYLNKFFRENEFSYPKSIFLVQDLIKHWANPDDIVLDFFAGSGTTAHAVLNLNKEDGGDRKYILAEMGNYFDTVTKPRIQKVMYSDSWKDGEPEPDGTGQSHMFKYIELEQYEDTLDNIVLEQRTLDQFDDYLLHYILDVESRDSLCRVNLDAFRNPFEYKLRIRRADGKGHEDRTVDLVDTFNYLLGLRVKQLVPFDNEATSTHYQVVHGTLPSKQSATIIWRKCTTDEVFLKADKAFIEEHVLTELPADVVYVNGYCFVDGARPIEKEFKDLMGA
ncbi:site-specific DNA-methyltransferase [Methanoculleus sp. FWC-SCC1]|uniref:Site-specific DNA-methyltransferase n=1 Tax=Methanoculleus frigidifontis TaxID=2584085 RepID=A0ABT8M6N1_9EURY|nr:site-specific DNA-methyltransferase [Methanoculleus sp. FWC-SCC1]MDN7023588.1 site-specific DNA-methyltransferase [Methanoculleus sp. FWC-SCC1]